MQLRMTENIIILVVEVYQVDINLTYNSADKHFDFDSDMNPWTVARAMAR